MSDTLPSSVNLNAFESRFRRICSSRCGSVTIVGGTFAPLTVTSNASRFCSATGWNARSIRSRSSVSGISDAARSIFPASTFERSRMSLIRSSRSEPAEWIVDENSTCFGVRLPSGLSPSSFARISSELSGVRSSCDMFARNSLLYFDESASCSAFSSSAERASSISWFLISIRAFCSSSWRAFSSSSSFVCWSSSCCCWSSSSDARSVAAVSSSSSFRCWSSSCCVWSSSDWLCSSCASDCDWSSSSSVRMFAWIVFSTTPIVSASCSMNVSCAGVKAWNAASSITAITSSSKRTGITMMLRGTASPSADAIRM